ncbi:unnamed protein product, partial [Prorocentrum cordatum]
HCTNPDASDPGGHGLTHLVCSRPRRCPQRWSHRTPSGARSDPPAPPRQVWREAVTEVLFSRLGVTPEQQQETPGHRPGVLPDHRGDIAFSSTYPGLKTSYIINEAGRGGRPQNRCWRFLGLPGGNDFVFTRQNVANAKRKITVTHWSWEPFDDCGAAGNHEEEDEASDFETVDENGQVVWTSSKRSSTRAAGTTRSLLGPIGDSKVAPPQALQAPG